MNARTFLLQCRKPFTITRALVVAVAVLAGLTLGLHQTARADDSCDTSEQVACISISGESGAGQLLGPSSAGGGAVNSAAAAVPILPPLECGGGPCPAPLICPGPQPLPAISDPGAVRRGADCARSNSLLPVALNFHHHQPWECSRRSRAAHTEHRGIAPLGVETR